MAHNLARWTARIGLGQQIVTTKTLRRRFFALAGRLTRSARRFTLHLPQRWPWETQFSRALARLRAIPLPARRPAADPTSPPTRASPGPRSPLPVSYPAISLSTATAGRHRRPQKRLQTARQPPILPEFEPGSSRLQLPHPPSAVLTPSIPVHRWIRGKGKRLPNPRTGNHLEDVKNIMRAFTHNINFPVETIDQFQITSPLDLSDKRAELVPEVYLTQPFPTEEEVRSEMREVVRNTFAYLVKIDRAEVHSASDKNHQASLPFHTNWRIFTAGEVFSIQRGHFHSIADLDPGEYITISRIGDDNGFVGFKDIPDGAYEWPVGTITVSTVTGDAFAQPVPFIATDNVVLCTPRPPYQAFKPASLVFAAQMLRRVKWRYSYGRQCYQNRFVNTEFTLPVTESGDLDYGYMEAVVESMPYWSYVLDSFEA